MRRVPATWWQQAAKLEGLLAVLPVPPAPSGKKSELLEELAGPVILPMPTLPQAKPVGLARDLRSLASRPRW
ncbi:MAG: hypothetical protein U0791_12330 [Gemmataceae bacterium]